MIILPKKIQLTATGKSWRVSYLHTPGKLAMLELPQRKLVIYGKRYSKRAVIKLLIKWIKIKAKEHLTALTIKLNEKVKVRYKKLRVRSLQTGWGNCSSDKTISLNYSVVFLPPILVRHLIIHELCHIRHLDHSEQFWNEVAKYDKRWKRNKVALHKAGIHIPDWVIF
jgi:predicted metal-dependent hydrolase